MFDNVKVLKVTPGSNVDLSEADKEFYDGLSPENKRLADLYPKGTVVRVEMDFYSLGYVKNEAGLLCTPFNVKEDRTAALVYNTVLKKEDLEGK